MKFKIDAVSTGGMKTIVKAGKFEIIIDEPENLGGTDEGANPLELVLAALAGCFTVVGNLVAREMGFELKGMNMEIEGEMNPAKFAGKSSVERAGFKSINIKISPDSSADRETLEKWVRVIEDRCPVTDNITNKTPFKVMIG